MPLAELSLPHALNMPLAATPAAGDVLEVFFWFAVAAAAALAGFYIAVAVRRWAQGSDAIQSFTFQDLRDMRARGQIDEREFTAMRAALLSRLNTTDVQGSVAASQTGSDRDRPSGPAAERGPERPDAPDDQAPR